MQRTLKIVSALVPLVAIEVVVLYSGHAQANRAADLNCKLDFSLSAPSPIYKHSAGSGFVICQNGKPMRVSIAASGSGSTMIKPRVERGTGLFTNVHQMSDVLGSYAAAAANPGAVKSETTQVLSNGDVSLALAGGYEGVGLGADIEQLVLLRGY
jgi:hypothetical protein